MFRNRLLDQAGRLLGIRTSEPTPHAPSTAAAVPTALTVETVLAQHAPLVRRIRVAYGYPDGEFRRHLHTPITALAAWIHMLPGLPGGGFERRGGAIEQALTNCLFSLQAADGRTFESSHTDTPSLHDKQRWRLVCALGGLFVSLPEVLGRVEVVSEDGHVWPGIGVPLLEWLTSLAVPKYHYRWRAARKESAWPAIYAASRCITPEALSFLDVRIAGALFSCIAGSDQSAGQVSEVVGRIAATVAERERPAATAPTPDLLAGTLKRLLGTSDWLPNAPGGHVWYGTDGLYLLWPDAAAKLVAALPQGVRGARRFASNDDLLQQLADSGTVHAKPSPLCLIRPPGHDKPQVAVRLADADRMLEESGRRATPLDLRPRTASSDNAAQDRVAGKERAGDGCCLQDGVATANDAGKAGMPEQRALDFAGALDVARGSLETDSMLRLDTSKIANPRLRELVDAAVVRLDQSFDSMLARVVRGGVLVALVEFVGRQGDGASVVRALHDAQLLAPDDAAPGRRVVSERIEGFDITGVVLRESALEGYADWKKRWQDNNVG
jgi:conjugal transfer pilus assembly protein TraI